MTMTETIELVTRSEATDAFGGYTETSRDVFCSVKSVSRNEFYLATAQKLKPEIVFVLTDYYDYEGEPIVVYKDVRFTVIRTYRKGRNLEIVCQRRTGT